MTVFSLTVFSPTVYDTGGDVAEEGLRGALRDNKNRWFAYDLPQEQEIKIDEFVQEYVQELKTSPKEIDIEPIVLKRIDAIDLLGSAIIQEAIRQAEIEYYNYLARRRKIDDETALLLLLN